MLIRPTLIISNFLLKSPPFCMSFFRIANLLLHPPLSLLNKGAGRVNSLPVTVLRGRSGMPSVVLLPFHPLRPSDPARFLLHLQLLGSHQRPPRNPAFAMSLRFSTLKTPLAAMVTRAATSTTRRRRRYRPLRPWRSLLVDLLAPFLRRQLQPSCNGRLSKRTDSSPTVSATLITPKLEDA